MAAQVLNLGVPALIHSTPENFKNRIKMNGIKIQQQRCWRINIETNKHTSFRSLAFFSSTSLLTIIKEVVGIGFFFHYKMSIKYIYFSFSFLVLEALVFAHFNIDFVITTTFPYLGNVWLAEKCTEFFLFLMHFLSLNIIVTHA